MPIQMFLALLWRAIALSLRDKNCIACDPHVHFFCRNGNRTASKIFVSSNAFEFTEHKHREAKVTNVREMVCLDFSLDRIHFPFVIRE